jgi:hypothetical protein
MGGGGVDNGKSRAISIIFTVFAVVLVGACLAGLRIFLRGVCCGGSYITPEELDTFKIVTDVTDDDYVYDDYDVDLTDENVNDDGFDHANDHDFDPEEGDGPAVEHEML